MLYAGAWTGFAGAFFLGFFISRRRASLFPMGESLPQVGDCGQSEAGSDGSFARRGSNVEF